MTADRTRDLRFPVLHGPLIPWFQLPVGRACQTYAPLSGWGCRRPKGHTGRHFNGYAIGSVYGDERRIRVVEVWS